ncbi:DUF5681 domain-containing protein [Sphingomonas profundi]|uniref:DUF5681 domain-containing protein n=1 Tax=Alterirhizorhabdus profundi TaxID=2681549 RepID=UPI0012E9163A|nr:DUF5681 domain-containing protein [Sphingomonas profundi]
MSWPHYNEPDDQDPDYQDPEQARSQSGRIKNGEVRNPKGRPTGRRNRASIIRKVALQKHPVMEKGRRRKRTAVEIIILLVRSRAAKGDNAAMKLFDGLQLRFSARETIPPHAVAIFPEKLTIEEFEAKFAHMRSRDDNP